MKIAILSAAEVSGWQSRCVDGPRAYDLVWTFGHVPTAVASVIEDGIEGVLMLTDNGENLEETSSPLH